MSLSTDTRTADEGIGLEPTPADPCPDEAEMVKMIEATVRRSAYAGRRFHAPRAYQTDHEPLTIVHKASQREFMVEVRVLETTGRDAEA